MLRNELPQDATLEEVQAHMCDYIDKAKVTKASVARSLNINEGRFNSFLTGKYPGDNEPLRKMSIQYLNLRLRRLELKKLDLKFFDTAQALNVKAVSKMVQLHRTMGVLYGNAGIGKTRSLEEFTRENTNVHMVTAYHSITALDLMQLICSALKVEAKGLDGTKMLAIIRTLENTDKTLIVDEAHHLTLKNLEKIRAIHDAANIGIILSSSSELIERMTGRKKHEYDQIFSRISIRREIKSGVTQKDIKGILESSDISYDQKMLDFCFGIAKKQGHYRTLRNVLQHATDLSNQNGKEMGLNVLRQAETMAFSVD
jgi:DNA transposition AAA+ family ATPase